MNKKIKFGLIGLGIAVLATGIYMRETYHQTMEAAHLETIETLKEKDLYGGIGENKEFADKNGLYPVKKVLTCTTDNIQGVINDFKKNGFTLKGVFLNGHSKEPLIVFNQIWIQKDTNNIQILEFITSGDTATACLVAWGYKYKTIEDKGT